MNNMVGGLIQMNSHMVVKEFAGAMIGFGIAFVCIGIIGGIVAILTDDSSRKVATVIAVLMIAGIAMVFIGMKAPRVQEIKACADGQVSIEQIAARYDIVKVDGKELTLRVR